MECEFDWNDYLESIKSIAVPEELFSHVESSLNNGIKQGMLLEVCHKHNPDVYWISQITMVCGHLLRIKFIGAQTDFWCDISTTKIHPLGWCGKYDELIEPPDEISEKYGDSIIDIMKKALLDGQSVSLEALNNKGLSPIDRIKVGMKVEVQNIIDPYRYWIATVQENVGGRLQLRYDGADEDLSDFWIFYCNPRLASFGFVTSKGTPWQFKFPGKVNKFSCKNKLSTQLRQSAEQSIKEPTPADIFQPSLTWEAHNFVTGMKLEALDPRDMKKIRPATVAKVFNNFHFLVTIDDHHEDYEETKMAWLCNSRHPYIYPIGWAQRNRVPFTNPKKWQDGPFDWDEYLTMTSSVPAPDYCFADKKPIKELRVDMKLEAVNPQNHEDIHVASIDAIVQHMVCIELVTIGEKFWCAQDSDLLFPVGWCDSNNYALHIPDMSIKREPKVEELKKVKKEKKAEEWCDRIYFNYKCYAGPSISRNKLSQLPKHVGPGPLTLVLKEVLNKIISASYKPAKLLKDWETEGPPEEGMRLEMLRAKLKSHTYHAYVPLATRAGGVGAFCRAACARLQACPALFGPAHFPDACPHHCQLQDKSVFHNGTERRGRPKGSCNGRRKKKKAAPEKREKEQQPQETESNKDSVESEHSSPSSPGARAASPRRRRGPPAYGSGKKHDSESENESSASRKHISDVSDGEEPELKKLKFSSHEPLPSDNMLQRHADVGALRSRLRLPANPLDWSVEHVHRYLRHTRDCGPLADRVRAEHIDGQALVMLDRDLLTEFLHMKKHFAAHLCNHITMIRWYYAVNFEDHDAA